MICSSLLENWNKTASSTHCMRKLAQSIPVVPGNFDLSFEDGHQRRCGRDIHSGVLRRSLVPPESCLNYLHSHPL